MLTPSFQSILATLLLGASVVSAASPLSLNLSGPKTVQGVENLKITATITNTGTETLKILNDPRGLLSKRPAHKFSITDTKGARPSFTGVKVKYVPEVAAKLGAYTVLGPGASISVAHDLSQGYNFTSAGAGTFDFEANNSFYIVKEDNEVELVRAEAEAVHTASIVGNLAIARRDAANTLSKRATYISCSSTRQSQLATAAASAETYAANAKSYLTAHTSSTTRYTTWFGTFISSRYNTVLSHFTKIDGNTFSSFTFDCSCTDSGTYAYVYADDFGTITLCGAFWNAPNTGTDSKAGTIIHESSHFTVNGGTDDHVYGQSAAKSLAISSPTQAIDNADSHEYFAENNPALA